MTPTAVAPAPAGFHATSLGLVDALSMPLDHSLVQEALLSGVPIVAFVTGHSVLLAPVDAPVRGVGGCFLCLARRWQSLRREEERDVLEKGGTLLPVAPLDITNDPLRGLVGSLVDVLASGEWPTSPRGYTMVHELDAATGVVSQFPLIADADCPHCELIVADAPERAVFSPSPQHKPSPESTRAKGVHEYGLEPDAFANRVCGMLGTVGAYALDSTSTAPVTGYTRVRGTHDHLHEFFWSGHADAFADSALLGILEGLERHSGLRPRGRDVAIVASYDEVRDRALDPRSVGLYPDEFYDHMHHQFTRFTDELEIPWCWGWSFRDQKALLVPQSFAFYLSQDVRTNFLAECSNGCATGSSQEEATLYGLLELIERDAFLNAWYGKAALPEIDLETCESRQVQHMVDRLSLQGYDVRMFDARFDLPIPVVAGVAVRRDGGPGLLCYAAGAGFDPLSAIQAALCEIASYVPGFDARVEAHRDDVLGMMEDYRKVTSLKHHALLHGMPEMVHHSDFLLKQDRPAQSMEDLYGEWNRARPRNLDISDDLQFVLDALFARGFDVLRVNQTSPEQETVGLHTVATIVPGLIPIDFGWTMQRALTMRRLRTLPVQLGWRDAPLEREDLNLVPHPFP